MQREVAKAEADVQLVRDRAARNQARLMAGQGTAKDLQALQHELDSLARRQAELEDIELEVMERAEALAARVAELEARAGRARRPASTSSSPRGTRAVAELDAEARHGRPAARADVVAGVGEDLVALYEKIRASSGGIGAAALRQRRCEGCRLELNQVDIEPHPRRRRRRGAALRGVPAHPRAHRRVRPVSRADATRRRGRRRLAGQPRAGRVRRARARRRAPARCSPSAPSSLGDRHATTSRSTPG